MGGLKLKLNKGSIANIATGGLYGAVKGAQKGDILGAVGSYGTAGIIGNQGVAQGALGNPVAGVGAMSGTQVNAADNSGYLGAANAMNPLADQYSQFAAQNQITSNVDPAFRQYQLGLAQQLQAQAAGHGPSLAQMQLQQATDRTMGQTIGAIRSATGSNAGMAARTAALAGAQGLGNAGNMSGQLRLQEQQQAQNALAGLSAQGRAGDISVNGQNMSAQQANAENALSGLQGQQSVRNTQLNAQGTALGYQNAADTATANNKNERTNKYIGAVANMMSMGLGAKK